MREKIRVASKVMQEIVALEAALDEAIACAADLTATCARGRQQLGLDASVGCDAISAIGEATESLHKARTAAINAHSELTQVRDDIGVPTIAGGGLWKPPTANLDKQEVAPMRKVA